MVIDKTDFKQEKDLTNCSGLLSSRPIFLLQGRAGRNILCLCHWKTGCFVRWEESSQSILEPDLANLNRRPWDPGWIFLFSFSSFNCVVSLGPHACLYDFCINRSLSLITEFVKHTNSRVRELGTVSPPPPPHTPLVHMSETIALILYKGRGTVFTAY